MQKSLGILGLAGALAFAGLSAPIEAQSNPRAVLMQLREDAQSLRNQGRYAEEEDLRRRLIEFITGLGASGTALHAQAISDLAEVLTARGKFEEAVSLQRSAIQMASRSLPADNPNMIAFHARLVQMLASQGKTREALQLSESIVDRARRIIGYPDRRTFQFDLNHARLLMDNGRNVEGGGLADAVRQMSSESYGPNDLLTIEATHITAIIFAQSGLARDAFPLYREAIAAREKAYGAEHPQTLRVKANYAIDLLDDGKASESAEILEQLLPLTEKVFGRDHAEYQIIRSAYATSLSDLGNFGLAEPLYKEVVTAERERAGYDNPYVLNALAGLAVLYERTGREDLAFATWTEIEGKAEQTLGAGNSQLLSAKRSLAIIAHKREDFATAEKLWTDYLTQLEAVRQEDDPQVSEANLSIATVRLAQPGKEHLAFEPIDNAYDTLRDLLGSYNFDADDSASFERMARGNNNYHRVMLDAAWSSSPSSEQGRSAAQPKAFEAAQRMLDNPAGQALAKAASRRLAAEKGTSASELASKQQQLTERLANLQARLMQPSYVFSDKQGGERSQLDRLVKALQDELDAANRQLADIAPDYFGLLRPEPLSIAETQQLLEPDEAALLVIPSSWGTHVFAVTSDAVNWVRSPWTAKQINDASVRLLWDVGANVDVSPSQAAKWEKEGTGVYPFDRTTAFQLYANTVGQVEDALAGKDHVFVAAYGILASLPFAMLVAEEPIGSDGDPKDLRGTEWFGDRHALVQIPSLQSLKLQRASTKAAHADSIEFRGYGNPVLSGGSATRGVSARNRGTSRNASLDLEQIVGAARGDERSLADPQKLRSLTALPGTVQELERIRSALGKGSESLHLGAQAREALIKSHDLSEVDILVFATHGLIAGEIGSSLEPGLVFTPPAAATELDDGLLVTSEIAQMEIGADWVILSACNTAAGDENSSSGLSGLAKAFFFAGAKNLLASHWPVRDDVAPELTVKAIQLSNEGKAASRAKAFQQAMIAIRNDTRADSHVDTWAHPSAWAPFTLIGDVGR